MTKRSNKTSPATPGRELRELATSDNSLAEVKKFSRWDTVEVELHDLNDGKSQLYIIADGEPLALWTDAYQNLEMKKTHARDVKNRLEKSNLIIKVSISELKQFYPRVHLACTAKYISNYYYFLSDGGYNRAILEVKTSGMKDREVADRIERRKDEIAAVFTKFKRGELSSTVSVDVGDYNKKDTSTLRGIRNDIIRTLARKKHPSNPNTVRRIIGSYHNDFAVVHGDNVPFVSGWLKDASDNVVEVTVAHTAFDISALAAGKLEISERREFEDILFKQFCPTLRPAHLTDSLDTTRQTKLLVEGEL